MSYIPAGLFLPEHEIAAAFASLFADSSRPKTGHGVKDDIVLLHKFGISYENLVFDTAIGAYILEPSRTRYEIGALAQEYLGLTLQTEEEFLGKGKSARPLCVLMRTRRRNLRQKRYAVLRCCVNISAHS